MSDRKDEQLNNDDLGEVKSLIGDARGDEFSLDDILAEFGSGKHLGRGAVPVDRLSGGGGEDSPDLPWPEPPRTRNRKNKVVDFPGGKPAPREETPPEEAFPPEEEPLDEAPMEEPPEEEPEEDEPGEDRVIGFPEEESVLTAFLKDVSQKADDYADRMFEEDERTDPEEVRRLERLIPGTDREEEPEEDIRRYRRPHKPEPPPPDLPPMELAREYG